MRYEDFIIDILSQMLNRNDIELRYSGTDRTTVIDVDGQSSELPHNVVKRLQHAAAYRGTAIGVEILEPYANDLKCRIRPIGKELFYTPIKITAPKEIIIGPSKSIIDPRFDGEIVYEVVAYNGIASMEEARRRFRKSYGSKGIEPYVVTSEPIQGFDNRFKVTCKFKTTKEPESSSIMMSTQQATQAMEALDRIISPKETIGADYEVYSRRQRNKRLAEAHKHKAETNDEYNRRLINEANNVERSGKYERGKRIVNERNDRKKRSWTVGGAIYWTLKWVVSTGVGALLVAWMTGAFS